MDSTKAKKSLQNFLVLKPFKNQDHKLKHTISATQKPYQEVQIQTLLQKEKSRKENTLIADTRVRTRTLTAATLERTLNFKPKTPTQEHLKFKKNTFKN